VTALRSTPASINHKESDEKINKIGKPAEKPNKAKIKTRRSPMALMLWVQEGVFAEGWFMRWPWVVSLSLLLTHVPTL
jgi:hypothetical protein